MDGNASCRRVVTRRRNSPGTIGSLAVFLLGIALIGCRQSPREPVTLRYTYSWNEDRPQDKGSVTAVHAGNGYSRQKYSDSGVHSQLR